MKKILLVIGIILFSMLANAQNIEGKISINSFNADIYFSAHIKNTPIYNVENTGGKICVFPYIIAGSNHTKKHFVTISYISKEWLYMKKLMILYSDGTKFIRLLNNDVDRDSPKNDDKVIETTTILFTEAEYDKLAETNIRIIQIVGDKFNISVKPDGYINKVLLYVRKMAKKD